MERSGLRLIFSSILAMFSSVVAVFGRPERGRSSQVPSSFQRLMVFWAVCRVVPVAVFIPPSWHTTAAMRRWTSGISGASGSCSSLDRLEARVWIVI
jgi:hypothetical protein